MPLWAQRGSAYKSYLALGPSVGITNYKGDLDDDFTLKFTRPGFGFNLIYNFHPHLRARIGYFQGWMGAADSVSVDKARRWRTSISGPTSPSFTSYLFTNFMRTLACIASARSFHLLFSRA